MWIGSIGLKPNIDPIRLMSTTFALSALVHRSNVCHSTVLNCRTSISVAKKHFGSCVTASKIARTEPSASQHCNSQIRVRAISATLSFARNGCEPRLLVMREPWWPVVMLDDDEPSVRQIVAPGVEIEETAIAITAPTLLVATSWVRAEQYASWSQGL